MVSGDLSSRGYGQPWSHTRSYSNRLNGTLDIKQNRNGAQWFLTDMPQLAQDGSGNIAVISIINDPLWFDKVGSNYVARYFIQETLVADTGNQQFIFTDTQGRIFKFHDFTVTGKEGQFKSFTDAFGHTNTATYDVNNLLTDYRNNSSSPTSAMAYAYYAGGDKDGRLQYATQQRDTTNIRQTVNDYYVTGDTFGSVGDLKSVKLQQWNAGTSAWNDLGTSYYRYYKSGDAHGFVHGLKYVVGPEAYARMVAAGITPETATDTQIASYADHYFEYDTSNRVTLEKVKGGLYSYSYTYTASGDTGNNYNHWTTKTVETLPDTNQNIVYTNFAGQVVLKVFKRVSDAAQWYEFYVYDSKGRVTSKAESSAVASYAEGSPAGVLNVTLNTNTGLIHVYVYYADVNPPTGGAPGRLQYDEVQQGSSGSPIKVREWQYTSKTVGSVTIYPVSKMILYQSDASGGSSPAETDYSYTWLKDANLNDTLQMESRTTTWPAVTTGQNGSGTSDSRVEWFDVYGFLTWIKDERGFLTRFKYEQASAGVIQRIDDVDTTQISDAPDVPSGWTTPTGGGLHLISDYTVDNLGRTTQALDPSHDIDISGTGTTIRRAYWTIYQDTTQEQWEGAGYQKLSDSSFTLINPISITRLDRANRVKELIQATRASTSGALSASDSFTQSSWVRWRNYNFDNNGRLTYERLYFLIPSTGTGTSGTNYSETDYGYTVSGLLNMMKTPGGTIARTVFHAKGWGLERWIGTNDTGATDSNPAGSGSPNNMVKVEAYEYDNNTAGGDGNRTKLTRYQDGSTSRVTAYGYDFRNRQTSVDGEIDFYQINTYDNLDRLMQVDRRNTTSSGNLIARSASNYDNRGRVYQRIRYAVDPSTGTVGNSLTDNFWYDPIGNLIKTKKAGSSALEKSIYDGVRRATKQYVSYNTSETGYPYPISVTSDTVFQQTEFGYDAGSNLIQQTIRQRMHDASGTGALGNPSTSPTARVSYLAFYPDALGRSQARADYGTNGASSFTRSATIPARSDTVLVISTSYNSRGEANQTTDPKATITQFAFDDAGRMTVKVEDQGTGHLNRETDYAYNADGKLKTLTAKNSVTGDQATQYVYGTTLTDSDVASNDLLRAVIYPDSDDVGSPLGNGSDGIYDRVEFKYNRLGEVKEKKDQVQTVHTRDYDALGRLAHDRITTLASGVDNAVLRVSRTYEVRGMLQNITSYNNATVGSGSVVNDVQFAYNTFGQLITEYQAHSGAVNTSTSPKVQYAYLRPSRLVRFWLPTGTLG